MRLKARLFPLLDIMILMLGLLLVVLAKAQLTVDSTNESEQEPIPQQQRQEPNIVNVVLFYDPEYQAFYFRKEVGGQLIGEELDPARPAHVSWAIEAAEQSDDTADAPADSSQVRAAARKARITVFAAGGTSMALAETRDRLEQLCRQLQNLPNVEDVMPPVYLPAPGGTTSIIGPLRAGFGVDHSRDDSTPEGSND